MKTILIFGYGRISKIKAPIYIKLGFDVFVYDNDELKRYNAVLDGYNVVNINKNTFKEFDVIDISTSSGTHIDVLNNFLKRDIKFRVIIVEKPLFSSLKEYYDLCNLIRIYPDISKKIFVNEQYYFSKTFKKLIKKISNDELIGIKIEMSKNRINDVLINNRFFDQSLEVLGVEYPHMIAVLDCIGINIENLKIKSSIKYVDKTLRYNQSIFTDIEHENISISLISSLGTIHSNMSCKCIETPIRRLHIITKNNSSIEITYDPVPNLPRYYSSVVVNNDYKSLFDNMLYESLKSLTQSSDICIDDRTKSCSLANAIKICKCLLWIAKNTYEKDV